MSEWVILMSEQGYRLGKRDFACTVSVLKRKGGVKINVGPAFCYNLFLLLSC